ncbi:MAG: hypothetical protein ABSF64_24625 [Bryobacteraceae bacterium]|jgi:hypothetical protein
MHAQLGRQTYRLHRHSAIGLPQPQQDGNCGGLPGAIGAEKS